MKGLTSRQNQVLSFIKDYIRANGFSPSYREVQHNFNFSSLAAVHNHLKALEKKGAILKERQMRRSVVPTEPIHRSEQCELPFIGHIAAGEKVELFSETQSIFVPAELVTAPDRCYVLKVKGASLEEEMILDGDLLLVEARSHFVKGETVVAILFGEETLVKQIEQQEERIFLSSRQKRVDPIVLSAEAVQVQGVVVGLIRLYQN